MAIAEFEPQTTREFEEQTPKSELEQILDGITPPQPDPADPRDPIEAQIYNLLGDITLPRSFLPGARAVATEYNGIRAEAFRLNFEARPHDLRNIQLIRSGHPYPGSSPKVDQDLIEEDTKKRFGKLISSKQMIALRDRAQEIYGKYVENEFKNHSTVESHFMRESTSLWNEMHDTAKDFLLYGDHRSIHLDVDDEEADQVVSRLMHEVDGFLRAGESQGRVFIDTQETRQSWWSENEIGFKFSKGETIALMIDDYVDRNERGVLIPFLSTLTEDETRRIKNLYNSGSNIGAFNVFFREHDWADFQYGIALNTEDWSRNEVAEFLQKYVAFIKTAKRITPVDPLISEG